MKRSQSGMLILIAAASLAIAADDEEAKALPDASRQGHHREGVPLMPWNR